MSSSPLARLRQKFLLEAIPDTIDVPANTDQSARIVAIDRATIDEIEFALVELGRQQSELCELTNALSAVIRMARRQGACGTDVAISAAVCEMEERN